MDGAAIAAFELGSARVCRSLLAQALEGPDGDHLALLSQRAVWKPSLVPAGEGERFGGTALERGARPLEQSRLADPVGAGRTRGGRSSRGAPGGAARGWVCHRSGGSLDVAVGR